LQILFKENWRYYNNGGAWLEYVEDRSGEGLLEQVKLEDIKPGQPYYMQQIYRKNEFHPTVFHQSVSWSSIEEIHKTGRIWKLKQ
jgi:hypothetical protein